VKGAQDEDMAAKRLLEAKLPACWQQRRERPRPVVKPLVAEGAARGTDLGGESPSRVEDLGGKDGVENVAVARLVLDDPEQVERYAAHDHGLQGEAAGGEVAVEGSECAARIHVVSK